MTRVAIVEDHPVVRQGLKSVIEKTTGLDLMAAVRSIEEFPVFDDDRRTEVVLLDLHLPGMSGAAAIQHMTQQGFAILVLTISRNMDDIEDAIEAGARGYLTKDTDLSEIVRAIETVATGGS